LIGPQRKDFVDLREEGAALPPGHSHAQCPGYIGSHGGQDEYWLLHDSLEQLVGSTAAANALKANLEARRLIVTEGEGAGKRYVVKRELPALGRVRVVALRVRPVPPVSPGTKPASVIARQANR
jgi:hypothetical protein